MVSNTEQNARGLVISGELRWLLMKTGGITMSKRQEVLQSEKSNWTFYLVVLAFVFLFSTVSLSFGAATESSGPEDKTLPTYYYYHGQPLNLELDQNRLAVKYDKKATPEEQPSTSALGVNINSATSTGVSGRYLLDLATPLSDAFDAGQKISQLLTNPKVEFASPVFQGNYGHWITMTQEILLQFKPEYRAQADALLSSLAPELQIIRKGFAHLPGAYVLRSTSRNGFVVLSAANRLAEDSRIAWAEPNAHFSGHSALTPNDPGFPDLWGILNTGQFGGTVDMDMDGDSAWDTHTGDSTIKVLIIESGVQQDHPDINQLPGADFTGEGGGGGPVNACDQHGTWVAGCVSAIINNSLGTVGIAPGCKSLSARTFISSIPCDGSWNADYLWTVDALDWAEQQGARVSNNSNIYGGTSSAMEAKYQSTYDNGMVHFAAAGNFSSSNITYPASIPVVNAISALNRTGLKASFSNYGNGLDFSAPGQDIYTTARGSSYTFVSGTSFASPYSAGVAALILSQNPALTPAQVEDIMKCTSKDRGVVGYDLTYGWGIVNAENALLNLPETDPDNDGFASQCDNCPSNFNPLQQNIIPGDANANLSLGLDDLIATANYIFSKAGCTPLPLCWLSGLLCRGDWNGDGSVALNDAIRAANYLFSKPGGPWNPLPSGICCVSPS